MKIDFDAVVIGAGVIGLACARNLSMQGFKTLVIEKIHILAKKLAQGTVKLSIQAYIIAKVQINLIYAEMDYSSFMNTVRKIR